MQIIFAAAPTSSRLIARVVNLGAVPADLEAVLIEGAAASRFTGKSAQLFEGFVTRGESVVRIVLLGAGEKGDTGRIRALEKAGAALTAKYLTSGETSLAGYHPTAVLRRGARCEIIGSGGVWIKRSSRFGRDRRFYPNAGLPSIGRLPRTLLCFGA